MLRFASAERLSDRKDFGGAVEDLLTDVSGADHNFQLPAKAHAPVLGEHTAMLEVPSATCEPVWALGHCCLAARQVWCGTIGVGIAEQDNQTPREV